MRPELVRDLEEFRALSAQESRRKGDDTWINAVFGGLGRLPADIAT
jgi:hypothetical protein